MTQSSDRFRFIRNHVSRSRLEYRFGRCKLFGHTLGREHTTTALKFFVCLPMTQVLAAESALLLLVETKRERKGRQPWRKIMADIIKDFLNESLDQELVKLESDPTSRKLLDSIFRTIHTIKGSCVFLVSPGWKRLPTRERTCFRNCGKLGSP